MNKPFWKSRSCWGALLLAIGGMSTAIAQYLNGSIDLNNLIPQLLLYGGQALGIFGLRFAMK